MCIFEQTTGNVYSDEGELLGNGYSGGNAGKNPEGINNPEYQNQHNIGPIPEGLWKMGEPYHHQHLGPFAIPLTPFPETETFGRTEFFVHGDNFKGNRSASDGCIIQKRTVREAMYYDTPDKILKVVSELPKDYLGEA